MTGRHQPGSEEPALDDGAGGPGRRPVRAFVGLGANLGQPVEQVLEAARRLEALGPLRLSSLYRTEPLGPADQPWYVNAVVELTTRLDPRELLAVLHRIEADAGRERASERRWGARRLDLDLLLYGDHVSDGPAAPRIPHPELAGRRFVLEPLAELAPDVRDPRSGRSARDLLAGLDDPLRVEKLPAPVYPGTGDACDNPAKASHTSRRPRGGPR